MSAPTEHRAADGDEKIDTSTKLPEFHTFMFKNAKFVVDKRYKPKKALGEGAYGFVWYVHADKWHLGRV